MASSLDWFERIVRQSPAPAFREAGAEASLHPFDQRNIHPGLPPKVRELFDDGHYAEATLKAFVFIENEVQRHSGSPEIGWKLMVDVFDETKPVLKLTPMSNPSEISEQKGFRFIFAGSSQAIRNPRAHLAALIDSPDLCLDHLSFASLLLGRLEQAGFV